MICEDFTLCTELVIRAKQNMQNYIFLGSYERSRLKGTKKVNEIKDGFLILIYMIKEFFKNYKMKKVALITGITGQDGSYLAELLLKKKI